MFVVFIHHHPRPFETVGHDMQFITIFFTNITFITVSNYYKSFSIIFYFLITLSILLQNLKQVALVNVYLRLNLL